MSEGKGPRERKIPEGDVHERDVCPECGFIEYDNPKIINVVVPVYNDGKDDWFLLARRGIEPRKGFWTLPGGYMEKGETVQEGGARETSEEAGADVKVGALLMIFTPAEKNEVIMVFRGAMDKKIADPGVESLEVEFFKWDQIPWKELAFPFITEGLKAYQDAKGKTEFQPKMVTGQPWKKPDPHHCAPDAPGACKHPHTHDAPKP